jgi:hypothetical protein
MICGEVNPGEEYHMATTHGHSLMLKVKGKELYRFEVRIEALLNGLARACLLISHAECPALGRQTHLRPKAVGNLEGGWLAPAATLKQENSALRKWSALCSDSCCSCTHYIRKCIRLPGNTAHQRARAHYSRCCRSRRGESHGKDRMAMP